LIGGDPHSWGLSHKGLLWHAGESWQYTEKFPENVPTTVGLLFDGIKGTLRFYKDGQDLGMAFSGLDIEEPLYPMIASTVARSEITLGSRRRMQWNLQDWCLTTLANSLPENYDISVLPLPSYMKRALENRLDAHMRYS